MQSDILTLAQAFIDVLAWFLYPFAIMVGVTWVVSLFRSH